MPRQYTQEQREKQRARVKAHYESNKEYYKEKAKRQRATYKQKVRDYISTYLGKNPCIDCGMSDKRVLEFDHVRGEKLFNISDGIKRQMNLDKIKNEIKKCDVRCANCHRIVTSERGNWHNSNKTK